MDYIFVLNQVLGFILALYGDPGLPRTIVQNLIDFVKTFVRSTYLPSLKKDLLGILQNENISPYCLYEIDKCFERHCNVFDAVDTESKRFSILKQKGLLLDYQEFEFGKTYVHDIVNNTEVLTPQSMYGIHIPLRHSLKLFLEIPGMFSQIKEYISKLRSELKIITNIIQGELWKKKYMPNFTDNEIVLPLYIFVDDLETGNPLGSHAGKNKFGAVYASIACLPPHLSASLSSIIFSTIYYSEEKKESDNKSVFKILIDELNYLRENGILINLGNLTKQVKFQLVAILGDNLGLNGICGFVECFKAKFCCRICKISADDYAQYTVEDDSKLRNRDNYTKDIASKNESETGIKEECVFNKVNGFHIVDNLSVDLMHDVLEGVCVYVIRSLLYTFIFEKKYFTLQMLNMKIATFDFGSDNSNRPPLIKMKHGKNKLNLKLSAAEMLCLVRYLGLIIGDLIPESDIHWNLFKILRQIVDILMSPRIVLTDVKTLNSLIQSLTELYAKYYGKLKPKFHYLIHYGRILINNGPLVKFWCMRFESYHRTLKATAESTSCKKNLLKTVATKQALKFGQMIYSLTFDKKIKFGPLKKIDHHNKFYEQIEICNTLYRIGTFLVLSMDDSEIKFGRINEIISVDNEIHFSFNVYEEIIFDHHLHSYIISDESIENKLVKYSDLPSIAPVLFVKKNNINYIVPRYGL